MVSNPPTDVGYVEEHGKVSLTLTEVGNSRLEAVGSNGYLIDPDEAERLIGKLEGAVEQARNG